MSKATDSDLQGQYYEVGQVNSISNKIKLANDAYIKANSTLVFTVVGAYGFSILQNPHTVEADKNANYLDLAKQNCLLANDMQFSRVSTTVQMGTPGWYAVYYFIQDKDGNEIKSEKIDVFVEDTTAPTIEYLGSLPITDGKIHMSYVEGMSSYTAPEFEIADNTTAGATLVEATVGEALNMEEAGVYTVEYYAVDNSSNESEHITVEIEVKEFVPAPTITGRKSATSGVKAIIQQNKVYKFEKYYIYTTQATNITIEKTDLDTGTTTTIGTYENTALDGLELTRGQYTIIAQGSTEESIATVTFTVDATATS